MDRNPQHQPRVLILYFSFSGQTAALLNRLATGLEEKGVEVVVERLQTEESLRFPIGTIARTIKMMLTTFLRFRVPVRPVSEACFAGYDTIILAGPTWSYNPSGPVLALLDRDGRRIFGGRKVLPLISCRGYWRLHWFGLRRILESCGAQVTNCIIFSHPHKEPWRTIGVFLKLAGRMPERSWLGRRYYKRYGHSKQQLEEACRFGTQLGEALLAGDDGSRLDFKTRRALP